MELQVVTAKGPANPQPAIGETPAKPAEQKSNDTQTSAAATGDAGTSVTETQPGQGAKPDKPGRRAAAAARLEREANERAAAAKKQEDSAKPVADKAAKYEAAVASGDVDAIMEALGITDEKLVDMYIAKHGEKTEPGEKKPDDSEIRKELDAIKKELADAKVKEQETEAQRAISSHIDSLKTITAKPEHADRFEMINAEGAHSLAFDVMVQFHKQHGKFLSYEEALDATEEHLVATERARYERASKIKKLGFSAPAKEEQKTGDKSTPAAANANSDDPVERMRAAFKATKPRITNALAASVPAAAPGPKSRSEADKRFRDRVLNLARAN